MVFIRARVVLCSTMITECSNVSRVKITVLVKVRIIIWISMFARLHTRAHVTLTLSMNFEGQKDTDHLAGKMLSFKMLDAGL